MIRKFAGLAALAGALVATPAAACWNAGTMQAAQIRHLDVMLMVSALRCRKGVDDFLPHYNRFVVRHRSVLQEASGALTSHYRNLGQKHADLALDRFVIGVANAYGAGHPSMGCGDLGALARQLADTPQDRETLTAAAYRNGTMELASGECRVRIAAR